MLCFSSNEARNAAEQCLWRLGWPKVSYIVFIFIVHLKFSQKRKEVFGHACERLTPHVNRMTCPSITYKCINTPSPPHRTQEKVSVFSTLPAYHSEEGWEEYWGLYHGCPLFLLFVFNFAGTRFILCTVPKRKILLFCNLLYLYGEYVIWFFRLHGMKWKGVFSLLMLHACGRGIRKWSMGILYYYLRDFYFSGLVRFYDWHVSENAPLKH